MHDHGSWWGWNYLVWSRGALAIKVLEDTKVWDKKDGCPFFLNNVKYRNIVLTLQEGKPGWDKAATPKP